MTLNTLSDVEKLFAKNWLKFLDADTALELVSENPDGLRKVMRETAFHEAGHFIARIFTGLDLSRIVEISIIPGRFTIGHIRVTAVSETCLNQLPPPAKWSKGFRLLLEILAGEWSYLILEKFPYQSILDYFHEEEKKEEFDEGSDYDRAVKIADVMARHYMTEGRILGLADKWTREMLTIPNVWNAVEAVAEILVSKGKITSKNNEISDLIDTLNVPSIYGIPKWTRRIFGEEKTLHRSSLQGQTQEIGPAFSRVPGNSDQ